ncbi:hypothetical protein FRC07_000562 [Ceratobasidium sp. 392]|nr:hypothetical protein FRC07_000562 [Ceratobasidium sp. 392]
MPQTMLPNSSRAMPMTNADRVKIEQPPGGIGFVEDPPDKSGEEMTREARVWRTYVRESDRWDKEMIDGRNNSLDVLLIGYDHRLSAYNIGCSILGHLDRSLGDLKPDPAQSSAQTLLLISQTLTAIANGHTAPSSIQGGPDSTIFSPSRSAVVVNILWLLSLSLSVAVSLIAMLAKDWCYKFMSGRTGPIYEQARRRQERWNGMERWKLTEVLAHLPGAMHLALLLFAAGLCVHLWDINASVAISVIVITFCLQSIGAALIALRQQSYFQL